MSGEFTAFLMIFMWIQGILVGYVIWAPITRFKQAFLDGLTFRFFRKRK
jgi:hypothetical protein